MGTTALIAIEGALVAALVGWVLWRRKKRREAAHAYVPWQEKEEPELSEADIAAYEERFAKVASPAVHFELTEEEEEENMETCRSRIGGRPDLPRDMAWPTSPSGAPMSFLAQFDLAKVAEAFSNSPLPRVGRLYFFAQCDTDIEFRADGSVDVALLFDGSGAPVQRRDFPQELGDDLAFDACRLDGGLVQTYPDPLHPAMRPLLTAEEHDDPNMDFWSEMNGETHLLGYPDRLQDLVEHEAERFWRARQSGGDPYKINLNERDEDVACRDWRLLFQLASESEPGMEWGDSGYLYFMIRERDLRDKRFDQVVCVLQCC